MTTQADLRPVKEAYPVGYRMGALVVGPFDPSGAALSGAALTAVGGYSFQRSLPIITAGRSVIPVPSTLEMCFGFMGVGADNEVVTFRQWGLKPITGTRRNQTTGPLGVSVVEYFGMPLIDGSYTLGGATMAGSQLFDAGTVHRLADTITITKDYTVGQSAKKLSFDGAAIAADAFAGLLYDVAPGFTHIVTEILKTANVPTVGYIVTG